MLSWSVEMLQHGLTLWILHFIMLEDIHGHCDAFSTNKVATMPSENHLERRLMAPWPMKMLQDGLATWTSRSPELAWAMYRQEGYLVAPNHRRWIRYTISVALACISYGPRGLSCLNTHGLDGDTPLSYLPAAKYPLSLSPSPNFTPLLKSLHTPDFT